MACSIVTQRCFGVPQMKTDKHITDELGRRQISTGAATLCRNLLYRCAAANLGM